MPETLGLQYWVSATETYTNAGVRHHLYGLSSNLLSFQSAVFLFACVCVGYCSTMWVCIGEYRKNESKNKECLCKCIQSLQHEL